MRSPPVSLSLLPSQWTNPIISPWRLFSMPAMKQAPSCVVTPLGGPIVWRRMPTSSIRPPAHPSQQTASSPQGSLALNMHKPSFQHWENQQPLPKSKRSSAGQRIRSKKSTQNQNQPPVPLPSRFLVHQQCTSPALIVFLLWRFPGVKGRPIGRPSLSCLLFAIHWGIC